MARGRPCRTVYPAARMSARGRRRGDAKAGMARRPAYGRPTTVYGEGDGNAVARPRDHPADRRDRGRRDHPSAAVRAGDRGPAAVLHGRARPHRSVTPPSPRAFAVDDAGLGGAPGVTAHGEIDVSTVSSLEAAVEAAIRESEGAFVVDLTDVDFIDSSGI